MISLNKFPCKKCILTGICYDYCDQLIKGHSPELSDSICNKKTCPDCGGKEFINITKNTMGHIDKCIFCDHVFKIKIGTRVSAERLLLGDFRASFRSKTLGRIKNDHNIK